ncbi:ParA family protein [Alicyclobacillus sp. SO9]|uniref:ParA family protein n=1 Tax=Alicyclobacillus sp. SO9 TaxID=2665646 RepID=UPI0018E76431|nr:ParA family protein [Alicyclobacillus sp. SO9]QQE81566.1 ParA family protein [Alicyclobacillus sp. SO9]
MTKVISIAVQKGGSGKTTSAGVIAYLLSQKFKVLAIDLDSQGNLTELLTQRDIYDFHEQTVLEAMQGKDASEYIHTVSESLDMLTADDLLATFSRWLYTEYKGNRSLILRETLQPIVSRYDYVIIDTPPALGDQTINALAASDAVLIMFETSQFCYSALGRFIETAEHVQKMVNPNLKIAGILRAIIDKRRVDSKALSELVEEEYPDLVFKSIVTRKAATGRLSIQGFNGNTEINDAVRQYKYVVKELLQRV